MFGASLGLGVRVWVATHQSSGPWTLERYTIAGWVLWSFGFFLLALAVASLPDRRIK